MRFAETYHVVRSGQLLVLLNEEGKFAALGGFNSSHNRARARQWDREIRDGHQLLFLVTAKGKWLIGSKPKSKEDDAAKQRRRRARQHTKLLKQQANAA